MSMQTGSHRRRMRPWLLMMALLSVQASAGIGSDWLPKVPAPPHNLDEALALCGGGDSKTYDADQDPWRKLDPQLDALDQKMQADTKAKMGRDNPQAQQDMAAQMMSQMADQMSDPGAMMANMQSAQVYNQYQMGLSAAAPGPAADTAFTPIYNDSLAAVNAILKIRDVRLGKCPMLNGEGGSYPAPACGDPIQADAQHKKDAAANTYLANVYKAWPQYLNNVRDYFKKVETLPPGVDANNAQIKLSRQGIPNQELDGIKKMAEVTHNICNNAVALKSKYGPDT